MSPTASPDRAVAGERRLDHQSPTAALTVAAAVIFVESSFFAVISPLLPYYKAAFGVTGVEAGWLVGMYFAGNLVAAVPAAVASRRLGPRTTAIAAIAILTLSTGGFALATTTGLLLVFRFLQGVGGVSAWISVSSWVGEAASPETRGRVVSTAMAAGSLGATAGPALAWIATATSPRGMFLGATALLLLMLGVLINLMPAKQHARPNSFELPPLGVAGVVTGATILIDAFVMGIVVVVAPLWLDDHGSSAQTIASVLLLASLLRVIGTRWAGGLADRVGDRRPLMTMAQSMLLAFLLLAGFQIRSVVIICTMAVWALLGMHMSIAAAAVARVSSDHATLWAGIALMWCGGLLLGSVGFAAIYEDLGFTAVCLTTAAVAAVLSALGSLAPPKLEDCT